MKKLWHEKAWRSYLDWQEKNKRTLRKINRLLQEIERNGYFSIGKPEPLKGNFSGFWSVRIDDYNRLVFRIYDDTIEILQCESHYKDD